MNDKADWSEFYIEAQIAMKRAEYLLALGQKDEARNNLGQAIMALTKAASIVRSATELTCD